MRTLLLLLLVGCGGSSGSPAKTVAEPAPAPAPTEPAAPPAVKPAQPAAPDVAAPGAPAPLPTLHERLRDFDGPVPGLPGFSIKRTASAEYCGGTKATITRGKTVAANDKQLAAVFGLEFPRGLDFDPKTKQASLKRFDDFVLTLTKTGGEAAKFYADRAGANDADPAVKLASIARVAQLQFQVAAVLARAEIPKDIRSGEFKDEAIQAYCDKMVEVSEALVVRAETARETCRSVAAQHTDVKGWWHDFCGSK